LNPDKKKIIFITVRSDIGGGPYHVNLLLKNLSDFFDFHIAAPLNKPYGIQWQEQFGMNRFFELPFRSFNLLTFFKLLSFIKNNSIGIIHSHGKGAGLYSRLAKIFLPQIKVIHTFHGIHIQEYKLISRNLYILLERLLNLLTDVFINVSFGEQNVCMQHKFFNKKKSRVIYNAISSIDCPIESKIEIRRKLELPLEKFCIISVLRFSYQKNLPLLIDIADRLNQNERFLFLIIGDGEQRKDVEQLILGKKITNIKLLGFRNNIVEYLSASDIYLSTSLWEGLAFSLIEATACGLPIIASDVTGNNELVTDGKNGYLFEINKPDIASKQILFLESSPNLQKIMGENSLEIFKDNFQLSTMIEKMKDIYTNSNTLYKL
jgi:glycosyltransferase involved in cell wall biosynthesis